MDSREFLKLAAETVADHLNRTKDLHPTMTKTVKPEDVYVVWSCKTLQNAKAILSTDVAKGVLYELTYNGDKDELYLDEYMKSINRKINLYHPSKEE